MIKKLIILSALSLLFLSFPRASYARCSDTKPVGKPVILSAQSGEKSVTLSWSEVPDPVTYYLVRYGTSKDSLIYGSTDIGGRGSTTYTIGDLQNGVKYYFQIRAGNGCRPGNFSDTSSAIPGGFVEGQSSQKPKNLSMYKQVLGVSAAATEDAQKYATKGATPRTKYVPENPDKTCAFRCQGLPFLLVGTALLLLYFFFAQVFSWLPPGFSVLVPIATTALFYYVNGKCGAYNFFCRYFLPLNIIVYVLTLVVQKYVIIETSKEKL